MKRENVMPQFFSNWATMEMPFPLSLSYRKISCQLRSHNIWHMADNFEICQLLDVGNWLATFHRT